MGRIIGLIGGTCLIIALLRLTNLQHDDQTLLGGVEVAAAQPKLTPRQQYRQGKELYLRGRIDEALPLLEAATASTSGLTIVDRRDAEEYLRRTRVKIAQRATGSADIRGQPPEQDPFAAQQSPSTPSTDAVRTRVERWMSLAQEALSKGDKAEAISFAQRAHDIATAAKLKFGPGEPSPAAFLGRLQSQPAAPAAAPKNSVPEWAQDGASAVVTADAQEERPVIDSVAHEAPAPAAPAKKLSTPKEQAMALLNSAREDIKAGRFDEARRKAIEAEQLDVTYDLLDLQPRHILSVVDRATGTLTVSKPGAKAAPATAAASTTAKPGPDAQKQEVQRLLQAAREDLKNGNLDGAKEKAEKAEKFDVAYKLFDDRPELVLSDIAAAMAASNIAQQAPPTAPVAAVQKPKVPASTATAAAAPTGATNPAPSADAKQLLVQARKALEEGRFDDARALALQADQLKAAYGLFDDRPELVLADADRLAARQPASPTKTSSVEFPAPSVATSSPPEATAPRETPSAPKVAAEFPPTAPPAEEFAPLSNKSLALRAQAAKLLKEARQHLQAGRLDDARAKAEAAEQLNVAFEVLDDRPDLVLADIDAAQSPKATKPVDFAAEPHADSAVQTADVKFEPSPRDFAPAAAEVHTITEVAPTGPSALQLYNQGMNLLGRGDRAGAHRAFLQAHQTGQRLDPVRQQRLQSYLRELSPKNPGKIQLAANQVSDNELNQTSPALAEEPSPLAQATQQQAVKFDRLRTETLNAVFRAERLRAKDPEKALEVIDQAIAAVEGADLGPESSVALLKSLEKTRQSLQSEITRQQPNIEQAKHNKEVMASIDGQLQHKIHVEQELARLVEECNTLYEQRRFAEAEVVAKKAMELDPKNPVVTQMFWRARFGGRAASNEDLKLAKEETFWRTLDDVEHSLVHDLSDDRPETFPHNWKDLSDRRKGKFHADNRPRSDEELRIQQSLEKRISLHEENSPLSEVIKKISAVADISIFFDPLGLEDEGVTSSTPVTINVDGIKVKSALNLMLESHHLAYTIQNDVLKITSRMRQQGDLVVATYPVADLVVPIPSFAPTMSNPIGVMSAGQGGSPMGGGQMSVPPGGQPFAQVGPDAIGGFAGMTGTGITDTSRLGGGAATVDFATLRDLITTTIAPDSWQEIGGNGTIHEYPTTLSLVVRQTQKIHEEIADLLEQLRRLQDLQVTIEVRFVTVSDRFFERIGIDFDFNIQDTAGGPNTDNNNVPLLPFGSVRVPQAGFATQGQQAQQQQGQQAQQAQQAQAGTNFFTPGPTRELTNRDNYPSGTIVGLSQPEQFSSTLDIPFQQGSFEIGVPDFGGFQPNAGIQFGLAVLSDIEAFFFVQAAQGDERSNLMFAPKVTLFNGQQATVTSQVTRPFVISLIPTVGFFSTGFQPVIQFFPDGVQLTVTAVVSADRRFVRLTLFPFFSNITDVFTFSFVGGANANVGGGGQGGQLGGQGIAGGGGFGGGGFGGGGGQFGIGGGMGSTQMVMNSLFGQQVGGQQGGIGGGQQGQRAQQGQAAGLTVTVQQPVIEFVSVTTTVSVPDGGTVLLGGVKRLREGRNMAGVPILNKIPYISRLFKNTGVGRETESLMLMVTPRIIIQEEEEELLGIPVGQ